MQVLESWRNKRVVDPQKLDEVLTTLDSRRASAALPSAEPTSPSSSAAPVSTSTSASAQGSSLALDPFEIKKRMEEDRSIGD